VYLTDPTKCHTRVVSVMWAHQWREVFTIRNMRLHCPRSSSPPESITSVPQIWLPIHKSSKKLDPVITRWDPRTRALRSHPAPGLPMLASDKTTESRWFLHPTATRRQSQDATTTERLWAVYQPPEARPQFEVYPADYPLSAGLTL